MNARLDAEDRIVRHASHLITTGIFLAAIAVNAVEIPRAAAQTKGPCSELISHRNSEFDEERRTKLEISGIERDLADAKSPNSGNLDKKIADALSTVNATRRKIAALEKAIRSSPDDHYGERESALQWSKDYLPMAQAQLDFWQAKQTEVLAGGTVAIQVPSSFVKNLETRLALLQGDHSLMERIVASFDREIANCRAKAHRTSTPDPCADQTSSEFQPSLDFQPFLGFREQLASQPMNQCRKVHTPTGNSNWSGTYKDGSATITISTIGDGLKGSWKNKFDGSGSQSDTAAFTCKVTGKTAHCDYTGSYNDTQKTISSRVGTVDLSIDGRTITATVHEVSDTLTWTNGDQGYTPGIHPGATFSGTWIRQ